MYSLNSNGELITIYTIIICNLNLFNTPHSYKETLYTTGLKSDSNYAMTLPIMCQKLPKIVLTQ